MRTSGLVFAEIGFDRDGCGPARPLTWVSVSTEPLVVVLSDVDSLAASVASLPSEAISLFREVALNRLPLVLSSTRTRAELDFIQQELGLHAPFICESGAAVSVPPGYFRGHLPNARAVGGALVVKFGPSYSEVITALKQTADQVAVDLVGVSDLSVDETALTWGVGTLEASRVKMRECGEPFRILRGSGRRGLLFRALRARGLACTTGGRSDYVGASVGERTGIALLKRLYRETFGPIVTVGVGSRRRDAELLAHVDVPLVVPDGDGPPEIMKPRPPTRVQWLTSLLRREGGATESANRSNRGRQPIERSASPIGGM